MKYGISKEKVRYFYWKIIRSVGKIGGLDEWSNVAGYDLKRLSEAC